MVGGTTLIVVPSLLSQCSKDNNDPGTPNPGKTLTIDLTNTNYNALNAPGGSVVVQGIIVANAGNNIFLALDSVCTHQGCTITYNLASNNFPCPCHGSVFSSNGSIVNGPATTALDSHLVTKSGNILTVTL